MRGRSQPEAGEAPSAQETAGQKGRQIAGGRGRQTCFTPVIPQASREPQHLSSQLQQGAHGASSSTRHSHQHQGCQGLQNSCCFPAWRNSHCRGAEAAPTHVHFTFKSSGLRGVSETEGDIIAIEKRPFPSASRKNERHHRRYGSGKQSLAEG